MKIQISYDKNSKVSLIKNIPEFSKLRLLGYNGIGKTLTANILASISGEDVWDKQEKIETLSKVIGDIIIKIKIQNNIYQINCDVNKWKIDELKGNLIPKTLGKILKNKNEISVEDFWKDFKCHIIRGNEDIDSQILKMADKIERIILYDINNLKESVDEYQQKLEVIYSILSQGGLCEQILEDFSDINENKIQEYDSSIIEDLGEISLHLNKIAKTDWISLDGGPKDTYVNLVSIFEELDIKLKEYKTKIQNIKNVLSSDERIKSEKILSEIKEKESELAELPFTLDKEKYPNEDSSIQGKHDTKRRIDELNKIGSSFTDFEFRDEFWNHTLSYLKGNLNDRDKDDNLTLLFKVDRKKELSAKDLREWQRESKNLDKETISKLSKFKNWKDDKEKLEEEQESFDEHIDLLKKEKLLQTRLENLKEKYQTFAKTKSEIDQLAKLEETYSNLEKYSIKLNSIKPHLENLKSYSNWKKISNKIDTQSAEHFIRTLEEFTDDIKELIIKKKKLRKKEEEYLKKIERKTKNLQVPEQIKKFIDNKEVIKLCKLYDKISNLSYPRLSRELEDDCKRAFNIIRNNDNGNQESLNSFLLDINGYIGGKLKELLNDEHFKKHVFNDCEVISVDPQNDIIKYKDKKDVVYKKFISDYSTGQKAFAFSLASILQIKLNTSRYSILFLDEFGAMLDEEKENYLLDYLNNLQKEQNWPVKYIIVLPYKKEFERIEYQNKKNIKELKQSIGVNGYAFEEL